MLTKKTICANIICMNKEKIIKQTIEEHAQAISEIGKNIETIISISDLIVETIGSKKTVYIAGNGGSASDAQHFAAELIGRFQKERGAYPSVCLNTDTSILTAVGNDYGFDKIFARQLEGLGKQDEVFIGISTSGNSENIVLAMEAAKKQGLKTIALLGRNGGKIKNMVDYPLVVSHEETARTQEAHITIIHILCKIIEEELSERSLG